LIAGMAYDPVADKDLQMRSLGELIQASSTKIAYLKHNFLPAYSQHFIEELVLAAHELF